MAEVEGILLNIVLNAIPVLVILIPFLFIHNKLAKKVYKRIFFGIVFFFLVYYILPVIFQEGVDTLNHGSVDILLGISYMFSRTASLIINYFQLPIVNFGFIFLFAPFISLAFLKRLIRSDKKEQFKDILNGVTFEVKKSPKEMIYERLFKGDWSEEKQLFKLMLVLLPISLYLLTTILKIGGIEIANIQDSSALGWFIEIFFAYLAVFLFGIHLLKASNTSFEGKFIGEKLENDVSTSLISVGAPISLLSIILFLVEYLDTFTIVLYFFGFFIMAAFIFVTYIAIFEPISIFLLIKIVNFVKNKSKKVEDKEQTIRFKSSLKQTNESSLIYPLVFGAMAFFVMLGIGSLSQYLASVLSGGDIEVFINEATFSLTQTLNSAFSLEIIQILGNIGFIIIILIIGLLLSIVIRSTRKLTSSVIFALIFLLIVLLIDLGPFIFGEGTKWVTGKLVTTDIFSNSFVIVTLRTAFINAQSENNILLYLAYPYQYSRYLSAFIFIGFVFYYVKQNFFTKTLRKEKFVEEITFTNLDLSPLEIDFITKDYLITALPNVVIPDKEREEVKKLFESLKNGKFSNDLRSDNESENKRIFTTLKYMHKNGWISWWIPDFVFTFKRAELDCLFVMYSDGRDVFSYKFSDTSKGADPSLVAGMFSAITSFIKETTSSSDLLRSIDHGDSKIIIEYGDYVFGAIFANMQTAEIRSKLKTFITKFEEKHRDILPNWNGNMGPFEKDADLLKEIFEI